MNPIAWDTGPISVLEEALEEAKKTGNWFEPIIFCAIQLERYGYKEIRTYFESVRIEPDLIENILDKPPIRFSRITDYLLKMKKIDEKEHNIMHRIGEERNKFMHRKKGYNYLIGTKAKKEYEPLVKEAIRILKEKLNAVRLYASRC